MKIHAIAAVLLLGAAFPAIAADAAHDWSGLYVGAQGGYHWGANDDVDIDFDTTSGTAVLIVNSALLGFHEALTADSPSPAGFMGGGQIGYNLQHASFVYGAELDFQIGPGSAMTTNWPPCPICDNGVFVPVNVSSELEWLATVRGRIGATFNRTLIYATGGMAFGKVRNTLDVGGTGDYYNQDSSTRSGWTVGGGAEYALTDKVSLRGEYLFYNLADTTITSLSETRGGHPYYFGSAKFSNDGQIVRVGVNYRF